MQDDVARHLEQDVSEKKYAGAEPVDGLAERQLLLHLELGEAHVDPIQIGRE